MAWSFNPFTGNLDLVGGGAVVFEGEVETFADLPETVGDPAVGASFLVRSSTGVWLVNRRQAGIWIRRNNTGVRATDWEYGGDYPVNSVNGQTGNVSLGSSDVAAEPIDYTVVTSATTLANGAKVAADTTAGAFTLTLPATPANGDTVSILDYAGTFDTNNLIIARNGSNIESLAEDMDCNIEDAAFSLVYVGSTVGWKVVPYFGNKTNFASPDPIGSSVANTGRFTTLTAGNGTITASAPVLDLSQTWNSAAVTFTGLTFSVTNTASAATSRVFNFLIGGTSRMAMNPSGDVLIGTSLTLRGDGLVNSGLAVICGTNVGINNNDLRMRSALPIQWSSTSSMDGTADLFLRREAAGTLSQYNLANPQAFRLYNTTDAGLTNFERGFLRWSSNVLQIGTEKGGTGSARALEFQTDGTTRLTLASTGLATFSGAVIAGGSGFNTNASLTLSTNFTMNAQATAATLECTSTPAGIRLYGLGNAVAANIERLHISTRTGASYFISTQATGTGTVRALELRTNDVARLTIEAAGGLTIADANDIAVGTTTGTKIGTATTQKIGFFNATPVTQRAAIADATDAATTQARLNDLLAAMRSLGLIAT